MNKFLNKILSRIDQIKNFLLDLLFPKQCVGCGIEGFWLCTDCHKKIVLINYQTCPNCKRITEHGQFCSRCRDKSYLTGLIVAAYYDEGPLKEAIHSFKYNGISDLAKDLSSIIKENLAKNFAKKAILISVPLHRKKLAKRGFNQSELIAIKIVDDKRTLLKNKLVRTKLTKKTQVELSGKARRENVKDCFAWRGKKDELKGKTVILVDDVYTTGSTLQECAKVLRSDAGVREIWGLVLAKA